MAGKPEQPSTHPAPPTHQQQQQHPSQQQQQHQEQARAQHAQGIQQNSVLVYVSGENFAYATAVGQNAAAAAAAAAAATAVGYQSPQQATYAGILPPQLATAAATFPAKTAIYCNDNNVTASNCCRLKPLEYAADGDGRVARLSEEEEDYGAIVSNNGLLYRQANVQATGASASMTCVVSDSKSGAGRGGMEGDPGNDAMNNVEAMGRVNGGDMVAGKLFPSRMGEMYPSGARLDGYGGRVAQGNPENCVGLLSDDAGCVYVRQGNEPSQSVFQGDGVEQRMEEKSRQDAYEGQGSGISASSSTPGVGVNSGGSVVVVVGNGGSGAASCDSVRSDTGESSTYSSLSSPESQSQTGHDGVAAVGGVSCAQQAARQPPLSCINNSSNNDNAGQNVVLTMNGGAVVAQQQQQQQAITVPRGWKRICTNGVIIYIRYPLHPPASK